MVITLHLEAKTAYMAEIFHHAGAEVAITGSNPLSTQDDVAAALVEDGLHVFAWHDCTPEEYDTFINKALDIKPDFVIDDGGDLVHMLHTKRRELLSGIIGGSEETTTGVHRLRALANEGKLEFPMIAANDAYCKYLFDNRYGTGQSTWDGIMRTTNVVIAGKNVVIAGYGWCGKGGAMRARGLGANVIVTEVDPIKAIEAVFDGFRVMPMDEAAKIGDIFLTLTGDKDIIRKRHFEVMKNGAIMANSGHLMSKSTFRSSSPSPSRVVRSARTSKNSSRRTAASSICSPKAASSTSLPATAIRQKSWTSRSVSSSSRRCIS